MEDALSYYTTHQGRMEYVAYRARGLQIGSGSVDSGCKQLVTARLKGAGMIWDAEGAEQVAVVRAWLTSGRWAAAMALRPAPGRGYERQEGVRQREDDGGGVGKEQGRAAAIPAAVPAGRGLPAEMLEQVRAELAQERQQHPWCRPWSSKQQRAHAEEQGGRLRPAAPA